MCFFYILSSLRAGEKECESEREREREGCFLFGSNQGQGKKRKKRFLFVLSIFFFPLASLSPSNCPRKSPLGKSSLSPVLRDSLAEIDILMSR